MAAEEPASAGARPKVRLRDHARVAWLFVQTLLGVIPYALYLPLSPIVGVVLRRRLRRRLAEVGDPELVDAGEAWEGLDPAALAGKRVFLVAGEASGDRKAARVVQELRARVPDVEILGYAGPACAAAGMRVDKDLTAHAVMGVLAVLGTVGFWWRLCAETLARFRDEQPDLLLTVDFPGLNVRLAGWARRAGIRTVHLVAPQIWAHTPWRIFRWRSAVDHLLSTMPFEPSLFARARIRTTYVGHPLFEAPLPPPRTSETRPMTDLTFELWPGSRSRELKHHVPILAAAAGLLRDAYLDVELVLPLAHERHRERVESLWVAAAPEERLPTLCVGTPPAAPGLLGALVKSGTATAEAAVDLVPEVAFYRLNFLTRLLSWSVLTTPWFCLANLVAGREVVPEHLVSGPRHAARLTADLLRQVDSDEAFAERRAQLQVVRGRLGAPDVASRAAALIARDLL